MNEEQGLKLLTHLIEEARSYGRGENEWLEFKTNIGECHSSITFEGMGEYISAMANAACIHDKDFAYLVLGVEDSTWKIVGTNLRKVAKEKFKENCIGKSYYKDIDQWSDERWLDVAKITINGSITNTAIILLGREEATHYVSPAVVQLTWKLEDEELAYQHFGPPLFLNATKLYQKIRNYKYKFFPSNELLSTSVDKYSSEVVLEGLNNAIAHQDYEMHEKIIVIEKNISLQDAILLDRIQKGVSITKEQAKHLREKQFIEGRYPHILISADIARRTGDVANYIRMKGVDKDFIKDQILKSLQIKNGIRAEEIEAGLGNKLSPQKTAKQKKEFIRNTLQSMKQKGLIICKGKLWYLSKEN